MIPRIVWILWLQGLETAPAIVRASVNSWERVNPDWTIQILSRKSLGDFLPEVDDPKSILSMSHPDATYSDIIRIELLSRYGGVWVDATCFCLQPLSRWLDGVTSENFFAFERPTPTRMLSSWFLAASQSSYIIHEWRKRINRHWQKRTDDPDYYWFHNLFGKTYQDDEKFRTVWDRVPKISAGPPHMFTPYETRLLGPVSEDDRQVVLSAKIPVLKLTHKVDHGAARAGSVYDFLCDYAKLISRRSTEHASGRYTAVSGKVSKTLSVLLCWYGSLEGNGTVGDLFAVQSVADRLKAAGIGFTHLTASSAFDISGHRTTWEEAIENDYTTLVFVCGPVIKSHPIVDTVIRRFPSLRKIGVSVSQFAPDHANYVQPFDTVLAREGSRQRFEDVAILAPQPVIQKHVRELDKRLVVGLVLRGEQGEYGPQTSLHVRTSALVVHVLESLAAKHRVETVEVEHHLARAGRRPSEIEALYSSCDLVLTSRFHGAILAMRNEIPFIAIDQIRGGGKLTNLLSTSGWPFVYRIEQANIQEVSRAALELAHGHNGDLLRNVTERAKTRATETLNALEELLETKAPAMLRPSSRSLLQRVRARWRRG
ncbi:hypothetical protein EOA60_15505 [Mesorhizobium sp. M1A.F.Ca.IN.020.06.1.1]|uniref:capsular polysaccharide synthesis protein n=1 Tax=unclassified Mesorhizobium TaxID=325217 RepID=UPI000FCA940E|nr:MULTISPECIES: capsular polysaccharide synthesis protein [unclassified Mesorhizobium]RUV06877.1 hypothetical protein EOA79_07135 [Mesorhizobium sp. M1A.F.Ca.IN.020.03.2.1]RUV84371.1 hypothetical protein EOA51_22020 [Mesorhizobium sp. M1A.F.Ca.IN.020.32.1.1]RUW10058.1 hypothetical protein EOA46_16345 [Mesorhizobium sp. M1A.F.Ca.IN.022.05.2.1]RUW29460.1 hypothetical protein EOA60_15505 [Mesorhizobium sp. M1A.F.Ca.IN.020.06.1.1]RWF83367.1 MAG: hypothetical protein EOQ35_06760 [Mesorhizobium sp.